MTSVARQSRLVPHVAAAFAGLLAIAACGVAPTVAATAGESSAPPAPSVAAADYLPGLGATVRLPRDDGPRPLVVLVPGGGWTSADPTGLIPLAEQLAADGSTTSLITYSTLGDESMFPTGVDDVACAIRWSALQATASGRPPSHVVVLGHSAGGHLAALVALSGDDFGGGCPYPKTAIDGLVGLAGVYDTDDVEPALEAWMGSTPQRDPRAWDRVNPMHWVAVGNGASGLRVALVHGDADVVVPLEQTTAFADALSGAGADVTTTIQPGVDHMSVFEAANAEPVIRAWLNDWGAAEPA